MVNEDDEGCRPEGVAVKVRGVLTLPSTSGSTLTIALVLG